MDSIRFFNPARLARQALAVCSSAGLSSAALAAAMCNAPANLIANAGFEQGSYAPGAAPTGWLFNSSYGASLGTWDKATAHSGRFSVRIDASALDDATWQQSVNVPANTLLFLGGWIKSDNIQRVGQPDSPGATVSVLGRWDQPAPTLGTTPWHPVGMSFSSDTSPLLITPRLGFWGGMASGTAWFDDLTLVPRLASTPHPRWKILVLLYPQTDVTYTDAQGVSRHVKGAMSRSDIDRTLDQARHFVQQDIPALSSSNVLPEFTARLAHEPLKSLSPFFDGWWPAQGDVINELDPAFDSVIVIWEPRVQDVATGQPLVIGGDAAVTLDRGLQQTYTTLRVPYAGLNGHRNVYKQQWGVALTSYFQTMQLVQPPPVNLNPGATQYVNCQTGQHYTWQEETNSNPIPNSIYNNSSGFIHDYYSGTLAAAEAPTACLGFGASAWAWGGPVTHSGSKPTFSALERVHALIEQIDALERADMLAHGPAQSLRAMLLAERRILGNPHSPAAQAGLSIFIKHVKQLTRSGQLLPHAGKLLIEGAEAARSCAG